QHVNVLDEPSREVERLMLPDFTKRSPHNFADHVYPPELWICLQLSRAGQACCVACETSPRVSLRTGPGFWKLQYRCARLSACQLATCLLEQAREPTAGIIVIDIAAGLDCTDTVNNCSDLIEFEIYLGQVVEIAVRMRTHHECNL